MKKIFKINKAISFLFIMLLIITNSANMYAEKGVIDEPEIKIDYNTKQINPNGTTTYEVKNAKEIAESKNIEYNQDVKVNVTLFNDSKDYQEIQNIQPKLFEKIYNIKGPYNNCGAKAITQNDAYNSSNKTVNKSIALTGGVENSFSANVGIKADIVSASLGFDVTKSWTMTDTTTVNLEPYERVTVVAYPLRQTYTYDIKRFNSKIGTGEANKITGFCTVVK